MQKERDSGLIVPAGALFPAPLHPLVDLLSLFCALLGVDHSQLNASSNVSLVEAQSTLWLC